MVSLCSLEALDSKYYSGDIAVSEKTVPILMKTRNDLNATFWRAYPDSRVDLWDQNFVNGKYVIAYEFNPSLHQKLKSMLPKVCFRFRPSFCNKSHKLRRWRKSRK